VSFSFKGFFQDGAYRVFTFEMLVKDQARSDYWVRADLDLARKNKIQVQDLPLLCRAVLENRGELNGEHTITYSGAEMSQHATARSLADEKRRPRNTFRPRPAQSKVAKV
jgi:hypothetical protein